jgi:hypothetical protein
MNKFYFVMLALMLMASGNIKAQDDKLVVDHKNGTNAYSLNEVKRIDFGENGIVVKKSDASGDTYMFSDINKITFDVPSGIEAVQKSGNLLSMFIPKDGNSIIVNGWNDKEKTTVEIFNMGGSTCLKLRSWTGQPIDISSLKSGVYIIKLGKNKTTKFIKRS